MNRYLVFPAAAAVAWAQQTAPGDVEKALRAQVEKYYTLIQAKKFREAEKFVAEEGKDDYYNGKKPDITGFSIQAVTIDPDGMKATVVVKAGMVARAFGTAQIFEIPSETHWKMEDGEWRWYPIHSASIQTPFGVMQAPGAVVAKSGSIIAQSGVPDVESILNGVKLDKREITLTSQESEASVLLKNDLPGPVRVAVSLGGAPGVQVKEFAADLGASSSEALHFVLGDNSRAGDYAVLISVSPLGRDIQLTIHVK